MGQTALYSLASLTLAACGGGNAQLAGTPAPAPAPTPTGPPPPQATAWKPLRIGAGGFITGIDFSADGSTKVIRTDTSNGYVWDAALGEWRALFTATSLPASDYGEDSTLPSALTDGTGVYEARVAPSDPNRIYATYQGYVYRSSNKGLNFTRTSLPQQKIRANSGETKVFGPMMAVDPANPDIVYLGTESDGLFVTFDGGSNWAKVSSIPDAASGMATLVTFDRSSGTTNGRTNVIYVSSDGNGVYRSANAGSSFALTPGSPTKHIHIVCDQNGVLWYVDNSLASDNLKKFSSGAWTSVSAPGPKTQCVAIDPANANHIVIAEGGGHINQSFDGGANWTGTYWTQESRAAADIPWLAWTKEDYMSTGDMRFDPAASNKLYLAQGIGVWHCNPPATVTEFTWTSQSKGIEQLVANKILSPPGPAALALTWDRPVFRITNPDAFPAEHGPNRNNAICHGWSADYSLSDPYFIVGLFNNFGIQELGYSTDGGTTWTKFASVPAEVAAGKIGGSIAVSTRDNIVWVPNNNAQAYYSQDRGATWRPVIIPGLPSAGETGFGWAYFLNRHIVAADKVTPGVFYLYNYLAGVRELYRTTDGGANWQRILFDRNSRILRFQRQAGSGAGPGRASLFRFGRHQRRQPRPHRFHAIDRRRIDLDRGCERQGGQGVWFRQGGVGPKLSRHLHRRLCEQCIRDLAFG